VPPTLVVSPQNVVGQGDDRAAEGVRRRRLTSRHFDEIALQFGRPGTEEVIRDDQLLVPPDLLHVQFVRGAVGGLAVVDHRTTVVVGHCQRCIRP